MTWAMASNSLALNVTPTLMTSNCPNQHLSWARVRMSTAFRCSHYPSAQTLCVPNRTQEPCPAHSQPRPTLQPPHPCLAPADVARVLVKATDVLWDSTGSLCLHCCPLLLLSTLFTLPHSTRRIVTASECLSPLAWQCLKDRVPAYSSWHL